MTITHRTARGAGLALAAATALFLFWAIGALGVIGEEGDPADLMYLGVLGIAVGGAVGSRLEASGMARAMVATAIAQGLVAVIALLAGEQHSPVTSVVEILGVNAMFIVLFATSALLFGFAARQQRLRRGGAVRDRRGPLAVALRAAADVEEPLATRSHPRSGPTPDTGTPAVLR